MLDEPIDKTKEVNRMEFHAVIGAAYGDEGKGTIVAKLAAAANGRVLNVLTNGGAQRGHTVKFSNGKTFTNKHFGSATYLQAANYFAPSFILDPMQFRTEYETYDDLSVDVFYRNKACRWVTPFDIMANQAEAKLRKLHNTCGMGIWKTIQRFNKSSTFNKLFDDFIALDFDQQFKYLELIAIYYISDYDSFSMWPNEYKVFFTDRVIRSNLIAHFIEDCIFMAQNTKPVDDITKEKGFLTEKLIDNFDRIIFENGQGLAIGDNGTDDSFATPSKTGYNALPKEFLDYIKANNKTINLHYVSRTYETRHGDDSSFSNMERKAISSYIKEDTNNHYNMWQGEFKYKPLDVGQLNARIAKDLSGVVNANVYLDLTHCDEIGPEGIVCPFAKTITYTGSAVVEK